MRFKVKGIDKDGEIYKKQIDAENMQEAIEILKKEKIVVEKIVPVNKIFNFRTTINTKKLILFCGKASSLLKILTIIDALNILIDGETDRNFKNILIDIEKETKDGNELSLCFKKRKEFPPIIYSILQIGETTGNYSKSFQILNEYFSKKYGWSKKLKKALYYPVSIMIISIIAMFIIVNFALPNLLAAINGVGGNLNIVTRGLILVTNILQKYGLMIFVAAITVVSIAVYLIRTKFKLAFDKFIFKIPVFNKLYKKIVSTQFASTYLTLNDAGVPIIISLSLIKDIMKNLYVKEHIETIKDKVSKGETISANISTDIFDKSVIDLLKVTEEIGESSSIKKILSYLDEETDSSINSLINIINPTLIIIMGFFVFLVVYGAISPMLNIYQNI